MYQTARRAAVSVIAAALFLSVTAMVPAQAANEAKIEVGDFSEAVESARLGAAKRPQARDVDTTSESMSVQAAAGPEDCLTGFFDDDLLALRYAGPNRYETAVCVSFWNWWDHDDNSDPDALKAQAVVLARGDIFPDALSGGPLAAHVEGPLLLTRPTSLPSAVLTEIKRVLAPGGDIYLLGGTSSISNSIRNQLAAEGYQITRLFGPNRYETAIEVAKQLPDTSNFFFATGRNFPDALGAGTAAAALTLAAKHSGDPDFRPFPLLLTADDTLPGVVADFVLDRADQFGEATLVTAGGWATRAVEDAFGEDSIAASYWGTNRYETAALIAEDIFTDFDTGELVGWGVGLATGTNFPDALAATPMLAIFGQPLLLTNPTSLNSHTRAFLNAHRGEGGIPGEVRLLEVFGGTSTVSNSVMNAAADAFS